MSDDESSSFEHENDQREDLNQGGNIFDQKPTATFITDDEWNSPIDRTFYKKRDNIKVNVDHQGIEEGEFGFKVKFKRHLKKKKFLFVVARRGVRILDYRTNEELTRFSFDRITKFLYNSDVDVFQFTIKLTDITVERYTFYTASAEDIFFTIKDFVARNIAEGVGKTKKLIQAKVDKLHTGHDHKEMTVDEESKSVQKREITDVIERSHDSASGDNGERTARPIVDITESDDYFVIKKTSKRRSRSPKPDKGMSSDSGSFKAAKRRSAVKSRSSKSKRKTDPKQVSQEESESTLRIFKRRTRSKSTDTRVRETQPTPPPDVHNMPVEKLKSTNSLVSLEDSDMEIFDL